MKTHHPITYQVVDNANDIPFIRWLGTNDTPTTSLLKPLQVVILSASEGSLSYLHSFFEQQTSLKPLQAGSPPLSPKERAGQTGQDHPRIKYMRGNMLNAGESVSPCDGLSTYQIAA